MSKLVIQVRLRSGTAERTCLIDNVRVKPGHQVTLKDSDEPGRLWDVIWVSSEPVRKAGIHQDWHAGGL